jgi:hypothetical protein
MDGLFGGPELDRDVAKDPAEETILKMENGSERDSGMFNVQASSVMCTNSEMPKTLSKRQLKKQKKKEKWLAHIPVKR